MPIRLVITTQKAQGETMKIMLCAAVVLSLGGIAASHANSIIPAGETRPADGSDLLAQAATADPAPVSVKPDAPAPQGNAGQTTHRVWLFPPIQNYLGR